jgi:hypothetical protein
LLLELNYRLPVLLRLWDPSASTACNQLRALVTAPHLRKLLLIIWKQRVLDKALTDTCVPPLDFHLLFPVHIDMFKANRMERRRRLDVHATKSVFGQLFQQLELHKHKQVDKYGDPDSNPYRFFIGYVRPLSSPFLRCLIYPLYDY